MSKEAMKLALEALEVATTPLAKDRQEVLRAQAALREALANEALDRMAENARELGLDYEPAQRQERTMKVEGPLHVVCHCDGCKAQQQEPEQPAQRKPLTFSKLCDIEYESTHRDGDFSILKFARAIEAAHGIKE